MARDDVRRLTRRANDQYLHWDKLRYKQMPEGVTPQDAWASIMMTRMAQFTPLEITFNGGNLKYWSPPQHVNWLHRIDQLAGGTIGGTSSDAIPDDERYLFDSLMEEAIASSQLEGAVTTRKAAKAMLRAKRRPKSKAERMILNNYNAILEIRDLRREKLTPEMLLHLQEVLTDGTLDDESASGRFRRDGDRVVVVDFEDNVLHTPPPAASLDFRVGEIGDFANEKSEPFIHPAIKAIVLHFAIGYVHPFVDGNGRTARAVFYWYMLKHGYWLVEYLPISRVFIKAPARYARAYLYTELDAGDVTYFIHYNLRAIIRAIDNLHDYLRRQRKKVNEAIKILQACPNINQRQASLLYHAIRRSGDRYTIKMYRGIHRVGYATARSDLLDLVSKGFLNKTMQGKMAVFRPVAELISRLKQNLAAGGEGQPN
jgi:Fic family protein